LDIRRGVIGYPSWQSYNLMPMDQDYLVHIADYPPAVYIPIEQAEEREEF
jgi:hypothetical protein